jgi:hypothetical protein
MTMRRVLVCLSLVAMCGTTTTLAQTKPIVSRVAVENVSSVIYIGNSFFHFNDGVSSYVARLLAAADPKSSLRADLVTIDGAGLNWHDVESYFRPNAIGLHTISSNKRTFANAAKLFDVAIMMDCSQCPVQPQLKTVFREYAKKHSETIRKHGAEPVLFMSWAYADMPEMTAQLAEAYTAAGNDNRAMVIPAGLAFARSAQRRPDINLYIADKRHPSLAGSYLAGATIYATLFGKSPIDLDYTAGLDPAVAKHLRTVAWEAVTDYFK